ncbi:MAG: hypothetical protein JST00_10865 [Deltaproteobacteria bacterium]|nr:hypothetical protein [Deltaproteobacteria bacterium]
MPALPRLSPRQSPVISERRESGFVAIDLDRRAIAAASLADAEDLLARGLLEQAGERFQAASRAFDEVGDIEGSARALLGLGKVLLGLENPVCREVLEDAGTYLEDLGDEPGVKEVDKLLRAAQASFEESPKSFVATRRSSFPPSR